ncbi:hypothetical protein DVT68_11810 [Dyella solisilvae]|uniref:DUF4386 family protein n=1 Tax=Dyella solisilvae TaxID=1920168 RepID=A0A370K928_9GAMM|nr:DUF6796 family protein [Dyella solisilvae]RDI99153.1 hypothetical protein DVT68_11810 [Dyella solisilvae]
MHPSEQRTWAGILGAIGAFGFFLGDQGLYFAAVSGAEFQAHLREIVVAAPTWRVLLGAGIAPWCTLLYLFGFWHVYLNIRDRQPRLGAAIALAMTMIYLFGSSYHVYWAAKALSMKAVAAARPMAPPALMTLYAQIHDFGARLYLGAEVFSYVGLLALPLLIALRRTAYPRWMALFTPAAPALLIQTFATAIPAPLGSVLVGGSINLSFLLFFIMSVVTTRSADSAIKVMDGMASAR